VRITNSMMADQFLRDANASLNRLSQAQNVVDSTKKISGIADDPLATLSSLKARNKLSNLADYQDSVSTAGSYLTENENAADSLNQVVQSVYQLMVSAGSAKTDEDKSTIADEVSNLRDEVISIANSTLGTNYLFSGESTKQPFSVDGSGHLIYNGIDLTKDSLGKEFSDNLTGITNDAATTSDLITELGSVSDYDAKNTVCPKIIDQLDDMIAKANTAIQAATKFGGVDSTTLQSLQDMVSSDSSTSLVSLKESLESEVSKDLDTGAGEANPFSTSTCQTILSNFSTQASDLTSALGVLNASGGALDISDIETALSEEAGNVKELRIGSTQSIQVSANGLELLGTGTSNIYCMLDKCVNILNGNLDSSLLSEMPAELQTAQSNVLSLETKIGTLQNRISMISDRYTSTKSTYTEMKSDAEDADMAEAIVNLTSAKTVYDAALAAGSKIVQTSLVDFLK